MSPPNESSHASLTCNKNKVASGTTHDTNDTDSPSTSSPTRADSSVGKIKSNNTIVANEVTVPPAASAGVLFVVVFPYIPLVGWLRPSDLFGATPLATIAMSMVIWFGLVRVMYMALEDLAWREMASPAMAIESSPEFFVTMFQHQKGAVLRPLLAGFSTGWGALGIHQYIVHLPMYLWALVQLMIECARRLPWKQTPDPVADAHLVRFIADTSLVLMVTLGEHDDGRHCELCFPDSLPFHEHRTDAGRVTKGLIVRFDAVHKKIHSATFIDESNTRQPVQTPNTLAGIVTRNELLFGALTLALATFVHPASHRLAEMNARQIGLAQVEDLRPSARFVVSLHEGLLHGPLSPVSAKGPLYVGYDMHVAMKTIAMEPTPNHNLDQRKRRIFPAFDFYWCGNGAVRRLVNKFNLASTINAEWLFHNVAMHSVDHQAAASAILAVPGKWSFDGSGSAHSYMQTLIFACFWASAHMNPLEEERVSQIKRPFYQELYATMAAIDKPRADCMMTSCSF